MEVLAKIKNWASELANVAVSLMALAIVLELLFGGAKSLPFLPVTDVIGSVTEVVKSLGSEGLVGLVAVWVLWSIWSKK